MSTYLGEIARRACWPLVAALSAAIAVMPHAAARDEGAKPKEKEKEEDGPADPLASGSYDGLAFRSIGPALVSGRVVSLAVNPRTKSQFYVGAASGGVWRTDDDGTTWTPVFEKEGSYSIGTVVLDPKDPSVVWVGSGENNSQRSVAYGDGVYRSLDGGHTWKNMGLKSSEHVARIVIDPRDSRTIYVAAQGPLWGPGGDRGVFKSTDRGETWTKSLYVSENTGATDLLQDPTNPDVLYAATYQRRRHVFTIINGGPEAAVHKSTDAGATWTKLTSGLPKGELGRIGLAMAPTNPSVLYAIVEATGEAGGIYRSADAGASWEKRSGYNNGPQYYSTLYVDPHDEDRLYVMGFYVQISSDGGKTLAPLTATHVHVDNHVLWVDPADTRHLLLGNDGGVYETRDRGAHWRWMANLPIVQFYDLAVDDARPFYNVYGGTQDNNSLGGPSRTTSQSGAVIEDWYITNEGDGFRSQIDAKDPNTLYVESQNGGLVRYDRRTGERFGIQPQEPRGELPQRWNWDSPLLISPHSHTRLYFGGNRLFRSDDRGDTWRAISPDLTRQLDRDTLPVMGKLWGPDSPNKHVSTSHYGNLVALAESPKLDGLLYTGSDDGLIHVSEDAGAHWRKIEHVPGVPDRMYVSRLVASRFDDQTVYAAFDAHKYADFKPYLLKSGDRGKTWKSIAGNLPANGTVLALVEDPKNPQLLFAGTEFGLWFTLDGGAHWVQMKGGLPTIAVRDAVIQERMGDLVLATFGRGFYVLDDMTALRQATPETLSQDAVLFPVRDALLYIEQSPLGGRRKSHLGDALYVADNPPFGAGFTFFLKQKLESLREQRQRAEKAAAAKSGSAYPTLPYPNRDALRKEAEEEAPALWLTVRDADGRVVRRISAPNKTGFNRVSWDLRYPPTQVTPALERPVVFNWDEPAVGPLVVPGRYTAQLSSRVRGVTKELSAPQSFQVVVQGEEGAKPEALGELHAFQRKVATLSRAVSAAGSFGTELQTAITALKRALAETPADTAALADKLAALEDELRLVARELHGDAVLRARNENTLASIDDRVNLILGDQRYALAAPSATHRANYEVAATEFAATLAKLESIRSGLVALEDAAESAGAPWTPGRLPRWRPE